MEKIELRIRGGLGNQLYQYSAAYYLLKKYHAKQLVIDTGEYEKYKVRNLEINQVLHNKNVLFSNDNHSLKNMIIRQVYQLYQKTYRIITRKRPSQKEFSFGKDKYLCVYIQGDYSHDYDCDFLHLYGYFVSSAIALAVKDDLIKDIWLPDSKKGRKYYEYSQLINNNWCIGVSIRCADDYKKNNWPICSSNYYRKGIEFILSRKQNQDPLVCVFADDIDFVKNEKWFNDYSNVVFIEGLSVCESFELLRNCSDYVCSNSSFSWWGAFLSYATKPIIVNPNKVFGGNDTKELDENTFYDEMFILNYSSGERV